MIKELMSQLKFKELMSLQTSNSSKNVEQKKSWKQQKSIF